MLAKNVSKTFNKKGIITDGLVGYWHAKQGISGTTWKNIAPLTVGNYDGTISGNPVLQSNGLFFDGVDDKVVIPSFPGLDNNFTYQILTGFSRIDRTNQYVFSWYNGSSLYSRFGKDANDRTFFNISQGSGPILDPLTYPVADVQNVYTFVMDGNARLHSSYIDNNLIAYNGNTLYAFTGKMTFGAYSDGTTTNLFYFRGTILAILLYNRPLIKSELTYNLGGIPNVGL